MTHRDLTDLLERAAERTDVGPPPLDGMLHGVRRRRRRHAVLGGAALTVVVAATAIAVPVLTNPSDDRTPATSQPRVPTISPSAATVDLEGRWIVTALVRENGRPAPVSYHHQRFGMVFRHGTVRAFDGCNELSGRYLVNDTRLRWRGLSSTLVGCIPGPAPFFERLSDVTSVARDQGGTYLDDAQGNVVVALARR